jgi:hypothetical protein
MRQRRWLELIKDYNLNVHYHPSDEDINTTPTPSLAPLGPLTRARARQLNHQVVYS